MLFGIKVVLLIGTGIILTALVMTDKQHKMLAAERASVWAVSERQKTRTHIIFTLVGPVAP